MKLSLKYYACLGIIDFFHLALSKHEVLKKLADGEKYFNDESEEQDYIYTHSKEIDDIEKIVKDIIYKHEKEYPHTIKYFSIPDFDWLMFRICVIAKISNNGSTYVFAPNKKFIESLDINIGTTIYEL